ncbi:hypothetical protein LTR46_011611, partial [Exophiala xenobiotica]
QDNHPPFPSILVNNVPPRKDIINKFEEQLATRPQDISANPFDCVNGYELFSSDDLTADHDLNDFHIPFDQGPVGQGWVDFMNPRKPNSSDTSADLVPPGQDLITEATRTVEELRVEKRRADLAQRRADISQAEVQSLKEKLHGVEIERELRVAEVRDLEAKLHDAKRDRDLAQQSIQEFESQRVKHVEKYHQIRKSLEEMCLPILE